MLNKLFVRPLEEQDYPELLEIENIIWTPENSPAPYYYASVDEYKQRSHNHLLFVATDGQKICGFIDVHHPTALVAHQKQWMLGIGVHPDSQSNGVGKLLLDYIKQVAPSHGIHKLSLRVMGTNPHAIRFYKKNAFVQEALFKDEFFFNGCYYDDYQFAYFVSE
ncbi:N-acetyltransferase family protein [Enterococcus sp. LJL99]